MLSPSADLNGRCSCCGGATDTGGCPRCASSITYCACGARVACGCGAKLEHSACPSVTTPTSTLLFANMFDANVW